MEMGTGGGPPEYFLVLAMWLTMTAVMMAPVVFPWLRALHRLATDQPSLALAPFAVGYGVAWVGFSAVVAMLHVGLDAAGLPVPLGVGAPAASATVLIVAGAYQFTGLKASCLIHCRSPVGYLLVRWRHGPVGWARLGLRHGLYCVGCCWALMALALVVGMTSLTWMGAMAAFMVAETALPFGYRLAKPAGVVLLAAGVAMLAS